MENNFRTPTCVAGIRGTTIEQIIEMLTGTTSTRVIQGLIRQFSQGVTIVVSSKQVTVTIKGQPPTPPKTFIPGEGPKIVIIGLPTIGDPSDDGDSGDDGDGTGDGSDDGDSGNDDGDSGDDDGNGGSGGGDSYRDSDDTSGYSGGDSGGSGDDWGGNTPSSPSIAFTNADFESGDLTGWTAVTTTAGQVGTTARYYDREHQENRTFTESPNDPSSSLLLQLVTPESTAPQTDTVAWEQWRTKPDAAPRYLTVDYNSWLTFDQGGLGHDYNVTFTLYSKYFSGSEWTATTSTKIITMDSGTQLVDPEWKTLAFDTTGLSEASEYKLSVTHTYDGDYPGTYPSDYFYGTAIDFICWVEDLSAITETTVTTVDN